MALYEIVIGNHGDDRTYSKLVLSEESLNETNVDGITGIDKEWGEYIIDVSIARISINSRNEEETDELINIKNQLS
jgi:hypothetical protein